MSEQITTKILDNLQRFNQTAEQVSAGKTISIPSREKVLGLNFMPGQKVIDSITGEEVEILGGNKFQYPTGKFQQ